MGEERAVSLKRGGGVGRRDNFIKHSIWQDHEIRNAQPSAWLIYTLPSTDCLIACLPTSISLIHPLKVSPTVHFVQCQGRAEHQDWHICQLFHREESNCQSYLCPSQSFNHRISTFLRSWVSSSMFFWIRNNLYHEDHRNTLILISMDAVDSGDSSLVTPVDSQSSAKFLINSCPKVDLSRHVPV